MSTITKVFMAVAIVVGMLSGRPVAEAMAQGSLTISNISDNKASYSNSQIPKFDKFEITFQVNNSVAQSFQLPYTGLPPNGLNPDDIGISVDAQFLPPGQSNWANAITQPAFYFQDFETDPAQAYGVPVKQNRNWLYPKNSTAWKVRWAPNQVGDWQFRLTVTDASGTTTTTPQSFTVSNSENKGFIQVSQSDNRYFEFAGGSYFPALGYNMNFNHINWISPILQNQNLFSAMGQNGVQLVRMWLSQWSIYGAGWNPWKGLSSQGGDPPETFLSSNVNQYADPEHELALMVGDATDRCVFHDPYNDAPIAVKPNTAYQIRLYIYPDGLVGSGGFVAKLGNDSGCATATPITGYVREDAASEWQWLTGSFTTTNQDYLNHLFLHLENMTGGNVRVAEVQIRELVDNNPIGPNILQKPLMDHHRYFDQRNSYAFDKVVELAKQNNVYLRPVIGDHREWTFTHIDHSGNPTGDFSGNGSYFYGPGNLTVNKTRWLQRAWWRYLQARWGYSTNIHSWEYVNEGDPNYTGHRISANMMGEYFDQFTPHQMVSTSVWSGSTSSWNLNNYPGIDFADVHCYIRRSTGSANPCAATNLFFDEAEAVVNASGKWGSINPTRWPVIRGETGFVTNDNLTADLDLRQDTNGIWLHNFLWATLNANSLIESYWYENMHIYNCPAGTNCPTTLTFDHRNKYRPLADFLSNIALNRGGYVDVAATGFDPQTAPFRVVGQKNTLTNRAHLWIQNKKHSWCAQIGGITGCPQTWDDSRLTGDIQVAGFLPNSTLDIQWWNFDENTNLTRSATSTITVSSEGVISLNLDSLPASVVDAGVKIGNYADENLPTATPTLPPVGVPGDANGDGHVDGVDYVIWLNNYDQTVSGGNSIGDFNSDGNVDGIDYVVWLNNYGN